MKSTKIHQPVGWYPGLSGDLRKHVGIERDSCALTAFLAQRSLGRVICEALPAVRRVLGMELRSRRPQAVTV